jgi:hypothetical protein
MTESQSPSVSVSAIGRTQNTVQQHISPALHIEHLKFHNDKSPASGYGINCPRRDRYEEQHLVSTVQQLQHGCQLTSPRYKPLLHAHILQ